MAVYISFILWILLISAANGLEPRECYNENGVAVSCEPPTQSFSFNQIPEVNSTCGFPPTGFCTREYNRILGLISSNCSSICDADDPVNAHPPSLMTDFLLTEQSWWQSENSIGTQHVVVIDLALRTLVQIEVIRFNFASFMPSSFYILKSDNFGETYVPYHFFAISCLDRFGIDPDQMLDLANETSVLCQNINLPPVPGATSFFPRIGRPSANDSIPGYSSMLLDFLMATNIRVVLSEHHEISNLAPNDFGYYYAISDLNVIGSCQCNGHASSCSRNLLTSEYECDCKHNTTGQYCERCADFYQDRPWQRANGNGDIECQMCSCNGHSSKCVFDADVYRDTGETSGGVCINCQHNTAGRQCDQCASLHYQLPELDISNVNACQPCNCHLPGVTDEGQCTQGAPEILGQCFCKPLVMGQACDQCIFGYFNLSAENPNGCVGCNCNSAGALSAVCNSISGVCDCKPSFTGDKCDRCLSNYYQPNPNSSEGCVPCNCNLGGSINPQCDLLTGQCVCRSGFQGRTCLDTIEGYFYPSVDYLRLEAEDATTNLVIDLNGENIRHTGIGYARVTTSSDRFYLGHLIFSVSGQYRVYIRYNLQGITTWQSVTLSIIPGPDIGGAPFPCGTNLTEITSNTSIILSSWPMGSGLTMSQDVCLRTGRLYSFVLHDFVSGFGGNPGQLDIDSLFLVPINVPSFSVFDDSQLVSDYLNCIDEYSRVITQSSATSSCASTIFTFSGAVYNGTLECDCDKTGAQSGTCEAFGGRCVCLPGVRGRRCDQCIPSFYNLTTSGCSSCNCDVNGSLNPYCDPNSGNCDCMENVVGRECSSCAEGFRDFGSLQCFDCNCNVTGSVSVNCDDVTGFCDCKPGVTGVTCDHCLESYYSFQQSGCSLCDCHTSGSLGANCNDVDGQCACAANTMGRDCSMCRDGTFNLQENNPNGCQSCFCSGLTSQCSSANGFVRSVLTTTFNSSANSLLNGWEITSSNENIDLIPSDSGVIVPSGSNVSLSAPSQYLGNMLSSYNQFLVVRLTSRNESIADSIPNFDIVLVSDSLRLHANLNRVTDGVYSVQFHEIAGWINLINSTQASILELQQVLLSITSLSISLRLDTDVVVSQISLETAVRSYGTGEPVTWVEQCDCPLGYSGLSCEQCAPGFTKTAPDICEPCQCNGFSVDCDPDTGICTNCTQSTEGSSCEACRQGHYGDPSRGISCEPCPCPLVQPNGQFSNECILLPNSQAMCTNCPHGHTGQNCESCISGYFGDPTGSLTGQPSMCTDCQCNGNIDQNDPLSCNATTGTCTRCLGNTSGDLCEQCADEFYGDAIDAKNCTGCGCDENGAQNNICNVVSGQCSCLPNIVGQRCDSCAPGYYGFGQQAGCLPCNCDITGSLSLQCDNSGQCTCFPGVTGANCDQCLQGYFNFSLNGCQECSCSPENSQSAVCANNGDCVCLPGSTGVDCRQCIQNYFQSSQGCTECPSCYQEIEVEAENAEIRLSIVQRRLSKLQDMLSSLGYSPFDPRLGAKQLVVENIVLIINTLSQREMNLTARFNSLRIIVMQVLQSQSTLIQNTLQQLQSSSTTVLVLGATSNELVDRIVSEFYAANSFLDIIRNELLPSIQLSAQRIQTSFANGLNISSALNETLSFVVSQIDEIQSDLFLLLTIIEDSREDIENVNNLFSNTSAIIDNLYHIQTLSIGYIEQVSSMVSALSSRLQMLQDRILSIENPRDPPKNYTLRQLIAVSDMTQTDIETDISNEISIRQQQLYTLNQTLVAEINKLRTIQLQLAANETRAIHQNIEVQSLQRDSYKIVDSVDQKIDLVDSILQILQEFNNNSLQISIQAAAALEYVTSINESAVFALNEADTLSKKISLVEQNVNSTKELIVDTSDILISVEQELLPLDTASPLSSEMLNIDQASSANNTANKLLTETQIIQDHVNNEISNIDILKSRITDVQDRVNATLTASIEAQFSITTLQNIFDELNLSDTNAVTNLETLLTTVSTEISSSNINDVSNFLQYRIEEQLRRRAELESTIINLQEQIQSLEQIYANLPIECTN